MRATLALVISILILSPGCELVVAQTHGGETPALESIHMIDALTGWAVTHNVDTLLRTTDGGAHWKDVTPSTTSGQQNGVGAVAVLTSLIAWAVTDGPRISHTVDGGRTWKSAPISVGPNDRLTSIQFIDPNDGWLLSETSVWMANEAVDIYRSTDGGEVWIKVASAAPDDQSSGLPTAGSKGAISFLSATTGWVTGRIGPAHDALFLYVTHDSGRTWREQSLPLPPQVVSPWFATTAPPMFFTTRDGILPVFYGAVAVFYVTHDGGTTWAYTTYVPVARSWDNPYSFADMNHGWVAEEDALYGTSDGGRQWMKIQPAESFGDVKQLDFVSPKVGWAVSKTFPWLLKTLDGGHTWAPVTYIIERR